MAYYKPLKGVRGIQTDYNRFRFFWDSAGNDYQAHFLWIYRESELQTPQMWSYSKCVDNSIQAVFQYRSMALQEIQKERFLIFLSDEQRAPGDRDLFEMSQRPEFLCQVYCGTASVAWKWVKENMGMGLFLKSDKKIPEGLLYFEYEFGMQKFQFGIPGEIQLGENYYGNIFFPPLYAMPQLRSREENVILSGGKGTKLDDDKGSIIKKFADMIRH